MRYRHCRSVWSARALRLVAEERDLARVVHLAQCITDLDDILSGFPDIVQRVYWCLRSWCRLVTESSAAGLSKLSDIRVHTDTSVMTSLLLVIQAAVATFVAILLVRKMMRKPSLPYPSGPPGTPVFGNALDIPKTAMSQSHQYAQWKRMYGRCSALHA